jgi:magnesium-transporting ATPase (P-type)
MSPSVSRESSAVNWGAFARLGIATVIAAVLANVLVDYVGGAIVTYDPEFVVLSNVSGAVIFTLASAIGAVLVYAALLRFSSNPARVFTIISAMVFIVTLIPDFTYIPTVPGASAGQTTILALMHVVAAIVIVRMLTTRTRPQTR